VLVAAACGFTATLAHAQSDDLISASQRGDLPAVDALLKSKADVSARKGSGYNTTALIEASKYGHLEVVEALLAAKADVNARLEGGDTALLLASENGHLG